MKKRKEYIISYITLLSLFSVFSLILSADSLAADESFTSEIINKYSVNIFTVNAFTKIQNDDKTKKENDNNYLRWRQNVGTAFSFDSDGHLITFNCVIKNAEKVQVISSSGESIMASVLGSEETGKINVLRISNLDAISIPKTVSCNNINVGEEIILLGINEKVIMAISGKITDIRSNDGTVIVAFSGYTGTSGAPVFDKNGNLLGLLAYKIEKNDPVSETDSYVVIPAESAWIIAKSIINGAEGKCGWLGISSSVNNINNSGKNGIVIQEVIKDSPAEKCGLKTNDFLFEFNSIEISAPIHLIDAITDTKAGDTISIKFRRGDKIISSNVTLSTHP